MSEFRRLNSSLGAARDRAQLLAGTSEPAHIGINTNSSGALLRERATVQTSTSAVDDVLNQAQSVSSSLLEQRRLFDAVGDKLVQVSMPLILPT
jgi:Golgi SNAP receptor complex protein 1